MTAATTVSTAKLLWGRGLQQQHHHHKIITLASRLNHIGGHSNLAATTTTVPTTAAACWPQTRSFSATPSPSSSSSSSTPSSSKKNVKNDGDDGFISSHAPSRRLKLGVGVAVGVAALVGMTLVDEKAKKKSLRRTPTEMFSLPDSRTPRRPTKDV